MKNGRVKAVRFATLVAIYEVPNCQLSDLLRRAANQLLADEPEVDLVHVPVGPAGQHPNAAASFARCWANATR